MVRKKVEGDEEQRRAAARAAERAGERPSSRSTTTGASKQRTHLGVHEATHEEKLAAQHRGKPRWRAGETAEEEAHNPAAEEPARSYRGRGRPPYGERHERVFQALVAAEEERPGRPVRVTDVAGRARLGERETRELLHDLVRSHGLVAELQDPGDGLGPAFETKPRR